MKEEDLFDVSDVGLVGVVAMEEERTVSIPHQVKIDTEELNGDVHVCIYSECSIKVK